MNPLEQGNYITRLLCKRYKANEEVVREAVYTAYSQIADKRKSVKDFNAYWYTASKYRLIDYFRKAKVEQSLEDWQLPVTYQGDENPKYSEDYNRELFHEVEDILSEKLTSYDYETFQFMRKGVSPTVQAERMNTSVVNVYRRRQHVVEESKKILATIYKNVEFFDWKDVTNDSPEINNTVCVKMEDGTEGKGYRIKAHIWLWANGHMMRHSPVKWKEG